MNFVLEMMNFVFKTMILRLFGDLFERPAGAAGFRSGSAVPDGGVQTRGRAVVQCNGDCPRRGEERSGRYPAQQSVFMYINEDSDDRK